MNASKIYTIILIVLGLVYVFVPQPYANYVIVLTMIGFWLKLRKENQEEQTRWNLINKLDWKIFLPIGLVILVYYAYKSQVGPVVYPAMISKIGILCFVVGVVNLAGKFMFRKPIENIKSTAIIGPNGAGKSTTLRIVATILTPTSGSAKVYGLDVQKQGDQVRQIINYLPEEAGAYKNLTGKDYLQFMAELYAKDKIQQKQFVDFAFEVTGLGNRLNDKVKTYSKGMTRKLLLARTVMTKPRLAILDEPTSGLDIINALEIRKTIRQLAQSGMAVLLSSHNMLEIEFLSDRVGIIYKGKIMETGKALDLKAKYHSSNLEEVFLEAIK